MVLFCLINTANFIYYSYNTINMVKILFTTDDIVKEFEVFAYLNGYDLRIIDIIVPMIRSENTILFKKDNQAG